MYYEVHDISMNMLSLIAVAMFLVGSLVLVLSRNKGYTVHTLVAD